MLSSTNFAFQCIHLYVYLIFCLTGEWDITINIYV